MMYSHKEYISTPKNQGKPASSALGL